MEQRDHSTSQNEATGDCSGCLWDRNEQLTDLSRASTSHGTSHNGCKSAAIPNIGHNYDKSKHNQQLH